MFETKVAQNGQKRRNSSHVHHCVMNMGGAREKHMFKPGNKLSYIRSYKKIVETKVAWNRPKLEMFPHVYRRLTSCSLGNLNIVFAEGLGTTVFKFDFRMKCSKQKLLETVKKEE